MPGVQGRYEFWTAYRKFYVRTALARGDSRALIAERLGITLSALRSAIRRLRLHEPERELVNG